MSDTEIKKGDLQMVGTLYSKETPQFVEGKDGNEGFYKRHFVLKTDEQFPQYIGFEMTGKPLKFLDEITSGDVVTVFYNLRGNMGSRTGKNFTYLRAFKIIKR